MCLCENLFILHFCSSLSLFFSFWGKYNIEYLNKLMNTLFIDEIVKLPSSFFLSNLICEVFSSLFSSSDAFSVNAIIIEHMLNESWGEQRDREMNVNCIDEKEISTNIYSELLKLKWLNNWRMEKKRVRESFPHEEKRRFIVF